MHVTGLKGVVWVSAERETDKRGVPQFLDTPLSDPLPAGPPHQAMLVSALW